MDIYDSRYFNINKRFLISFGLWPHQNYKQKLFLRSLIITAVVLILLPQIFRVCIYLKTDLDVVMEHVGIIIFFSSIFLKLLTTIIHEKKLERLYNNIVSNWQVITNKDERKVLIDYSERGRALTLFYVAYIICTIILFISVPTTPLVLNSIKSLNMSLEHMFLLGGEFFVDRDTYYTEIFIFDTICIIICAPLMCAFDSMYVVCVQHCLGLFAIIKFRLKQSTISHADKTLSKEERDSITYKYIIKTIQLHKNVLNFTEIIEATYSSTFLVLVGLNMLITSFACVLVLVRLDEIMYVLRFGFILVGSILHLFVLSWPGQALTDYSISLSDDAYTTEWYDASVDSQKSLKFLILRCIKPCQLTAGGIYVMNFSNFAMIIKTSVSYMTMFTSLR